MVESLEKPMFKRVFLAFLAVLALGSSQALAQARYPYDPYGPPVQPLDRILPQIRHGYPGTFYDAEGPYPDEAGNPHYHIKWMTPDGRVIWLDTDARTGHVFGVQGSGWHAQQFRGGPRFGPPGWSGRQFQGGNFGRSHWVSGRRGH